MVNVLMALQVALGIALIIVIMPQENKTAMQFLVWSRRKSDILQTKGKRQAYFKQNNWKVVLVLFFLNALALIIVTK